MAHGRAKGRGARELRPAMPLEFQGGWSGRVGRAILPLPVTLRAPPTPSQGQRSPARQSTQPREPALGSGLSSPGPGQPLLSWLLAPAPTPATCRRALAPLGGLSGGGAPAQCRAARAALVGGRVTVTASLPPRPRHGSRRRPARPSLPQHAGPRARCGSGTSRSPREGVNKQKDGVTDPWPPTRADLLDALPHALRRLLAVAR